MSRERRAATAAELCIRDALLACRRRLRVRAVGDVILLSAAVGGAISIVVVGAGAGAGTVRAIGVAAVIVVAAVAGVSWWRRVSLADAAAAIESRLPASRNLVVTAEAVLSGRLAPPHPVVRTDLFDAAAEQLAGQSTNVLAPIAGRLTLAVVAIGALAVWLARVPAASPAGAADASRVDVAGETALAPGDLRVVVTPPTYSGRPATEARNPATLTVLEGSRVRFEMAADSGSVGLVDADLVTTPFQPAGGSWWHEMVAATSRPLVIQHGRAGSGADKSWLVQLRVVPDERPAVRIRAPAGDLMFSKPAGTVAIEIEALDDVGLASLQLRYTRVSGSGESFTFKEGEAPVAIERTGGGAWNGRATLRLDTLQLEDGDTLVYRALAADRKPGHDPTTSDAFLIEIGRLAEAASTGFAVDRELDRQGLSQQMLIIKTERLQAERATLSPKAFAEQAQLLAVEQRMVRAEFVFMTGGHVEDEVEEAAAGHEIVEGRLENQGQAELLAATREMSRAEARLNGADTVQALVFERAALKALQRAFDRRRYLLRTLPERTRIDPSRRLTGDLAAARSSQAAERESDTDAVVRRARDLMARLADPRLVSGSQAHVASSLLSVDPGSPPLQQSALRLATAQDDGARLAAAREAQQLLVTIVRQRLEDVPGGRVRPDPLAGRLADEVVRRGGRR